LKANITAASIHPIDRLWDLMAAVAPYPAGVIAIPRRVAGTSFFPGGSGLWDTSSDKPMPPLPVDGIMILGHDYDSERGYKKTFRGGEENLNGPTWRNLIGLLKRANISLDRCFFTNFFMGLRVGDSSTGPFPGLKDAAFVKRCQDFLIHQLGAQRPKLVLTLGTYVPGLIANMTPGLLPWSRARNFEKIDAVDQGVLTGVTFDQLPTVPPMTFVSLVHPCYRQLNAGMRKYKSDCGEAAELRMLADAMSCAGAIPET
jgi:uracil-DNA glycosylase